RITRIGILFNLMMTGGLALALTLIERHALGLFLGPGSAATEIGVHIGRVATWGFIFFGVSMVLFGAVRA
ncbi:MAG TPA: MATE family efflux transporter, partial [Paracoccus sp. (in: a-proteobacteria)]|nr:MATE family efflux transporter [Paracoccus sp. (in: a-proteobacteria)]